jgi:concanavalin A-like lectin/glucanase superfamily protein/Calx-beta domain-containing protein/fibronectin type III domain protein
MWRSLIQTINRFGGGRGVARAGNSRRSIHHRRLLCEALEDRRLLSIGPYPDLPGMHLVDPRPDQFEGQVIYLDFDGAEDLTYNGPVVVDGIDVPVFEAPGELAGQEQEIIASIVGNLEETFGGTGLTITTDKPDLGSSYSTIYIGGDDLLFREHGQFQGLAEAVDFGNGISDDNAFVFSHTVEMSGDLSLLVEHELAHLLGYAHFNSNPEEISVQDCAASISYNGSSYYPSSSSSEFGFDEDGWDNIYSRAYVWYPLSALSTAETVYAYAHIVADLNRNPVPHMADIGVNFHKGDYDTFAGYSLQQKYTWCSYYGERIINWETEISKNETLESVSFSDEIYRAIRDEDEIAFSFFFDDTISGVLGRNDDCVFDYSTTISVDTYGAPSLTDEPNSEIDSALLEWEDLSLPAGDELKYHIQVSTNSNLSDPFVDVETTNTSYLLTDLADDTYYWRVRTVYSGSSVNRSTWSGTDSFEVTQQHRPDPPQAISPDNNAVTSRTPLLTASAFSDQDSDSHKATHWYVSTTMDYNGVVWDRYDTDLDKTQEQVPSGELDFDKPYYWWATYIDSTDRSSLPEEPLDDDVGNFRTESRPFPILSINNVSKTEGDSGAKTFRFTITMTGSNPVVASVNYAAADGTATTTDNDYEFTSGTLTWAAGNTSDKYIDVTVNGDTKHEPDQKFYVNLSGPSEATISDSQGEGTIENDDKVPLPSLCISDVTQTEGDIGAKVFSFEVGMSGSNSQGISVDYATWDGSATTSDNDYESESGTLTWAVGDTSNQYVNVTVNGDTKYETNERFDLILSNPTGATIFDNQGEGTIENDDSVKPTVSISATDSTAGEPSNDGRFRVSRTNTSGSLTVYYSVGGSATEGSDYENIPSSLTIQSGSSYGDVLIDVRDDSADEPTEHVVLTLSSNSNYIIDSSKNSATVGITDNDEVEPQIIDNGASGFTKSGTWHHFLGQGYKNDVHFAEKGSGSAKANWTFTVEPGQYEVAATWTTHDNRATDAPYTVFNGPSTALKTIDVNQEFAPNDFPDYGVNWENLGTFTITSNTLKVQLTNAANEYVIADAIRIERADDPTPPAAPTGLSASAASSSQINLSWSDNSNNEQGFKIERKTGSSGSWSHLKTLGAGVKSYSDTGLSSSTTYYYRVYAYNSAGSSPYSNGDSATTPSGVTWPVAWYPLDGNGEDSADDHDGTVHGAISAPDRFGNANSAMLFDGSNDYIAIADDPDLRPTTAMTVTAWFKPNSFNLGSYSWPAILKNVSDADQSGYTIEIAQVYEGTPKVGFSVSNADGPVSAGSFAVGTDKWYYLAGTYEYDPQTDQSTLTTFFGEHSGVLQSQSTVFSGPIKHSTLDLNIGRDNYNTGSNRHFNGTIDDVRIHNGALSEGEISALHTGDDPVAVLTGVTISGATSVNESSSADYTLTAYYDGRSPQNVTTSASWSENSTYATIVSSTGKLTTSSVTSNKSVRITASYGGKSDTHDVTIKNVIVEPQIIDNGESGFRTEGKWFSFPGQGYKNDVHFAEKGSGSAKAFWTFPVTPGQYEVAATWTPHKNRATDSPYTVFSGSTPLRTVDVNQELVPNDFTDKGVNWENLGTFTITSNTLKVRLSNAANEYVIADAIRIERVSGPEITVLGNGVSIEDGDTTPSPEEGTDFGSVLPGQPGPTQTFTVRNDGTETLTLGGITIMIFPPPPVVSVPPGYTLIEDLAINSLPPGASDTFTVRLDTVTEGTKGGQVSFFNNDSNENRFNFSITGTVGVEPPQVINNGESGFRTEGKWTPFPGQGYKNDVHFAAKGTGSAKAFWTFTVTPGQYDVAATWTPHKNRATDAPYTVWDSSTKLNTVDVNQEVAPSGITDEGVNWKKLGTFTITSNMLVVQLSNAANEYVIADAIRIMKV